MIGGLFLMRGICKICLLVLISGLFFAGEAIAKDNETAMPQTVSKAESYIPSCILALRNKLNLSDEQISKIILIARTTKIGVAAVLTEEQKQYLDRLAEKRINQIQKNYNCNFVESNMSGLDDIDLLENDYRYFSNCYPLSCCYDPLLYYESSDYKFQTAGLQGGGIKKGLDWRNHFGDLYWDNSCW
jgi:hypothetical protein